MYLYAGKAYVEDDAPGGHRNLKYMSNSSALCSVINDMSIYKETCQEHSPFFNAIIAGIPQQKLVKAVVFFCKDEKS